VSAICTQPPEEQHPVVAVWVLASESHSPRPGLRAVFVQGPGRTRCSAGEVPGALNNQVVAF